MMLHGWIVSNIYIFIIYGIKNQIFNFKFDSTNIMPIEQVHPNYLIYIFMQLNMHFLKVYKL